MQSKIINKRRRFQFLTYPELGNPKAATLHDFFNFEIRPKLRLFVRRCFDFDLRFAGVEATKLGSDQCYVEVQKLSPTALEKRIITLSTKPTENGEVGNFVVH